MLLPLQVKQFNMNKEAEALHGLAHNILEYQRKASIRNSSCSFTSLCSEKT